MNCLVVEVSHVSRLDDADQRSVTVTTACNVDEYVRRLLRDVGPKLPSVRGVF